MPCRKRRASSHDDGRISWFISSCSASVGFLLSYNRDLREPLMWPQGSPVSIPLATGCTTLLLSHSREIGPQDALKKDLEVFFEL